jgi:hypothetical protein
LFDPANKDFLDHMRALGKVSDKGEAVSDSKGGSVADNSDALGIAALKAVERMSERMEKNTASNPMVDVMKHAAIEGISLVSQQSKGGGFQEMFTVITAMNAPLMQMMGSQVESLQLQLREQRLQAAEDRKLMLELVSKATNPVPGGKDLITSATEMIQLTKMIGTRAAPTNEWAGLARELAPSVIELIAAIRLSNMQQGQGRQQQQTGGGVQTVNRQQQQVAAAAPAAQATAAKPEDQKVQEIKALFLAPENGPLIRMLINGFNRDSGWNFAHSIVLLSSEDTYYSIRAYGPTAIFAGSMTIPAIMEYFTGKEEEYKAFIADFMKYGDDPEAPAPSGGEEAK